MKVTKLGTALLLAALTATGARAAEPRAVVSAGQLPEGFSEALEGLETRRATVQAMTIANNAEWVIVSDRGVEASPGLPAPVRAAIDGAVGRRVGVEAVAMQGPRWAVIAGGELAGEGISAELGAGLRQARAARQTVTSVALPPGSPNDWAFTAGGRLYHSPGVAPGLIEAGDAAVRGQRKAEAVAIGADGSWVLAAGGWAPSGGAPAEMRAALDQLRTAGSRSLDRIVLRHNGGWAIYSNGARAAGAGPDRIENNLLSGQSIYRRMEENQVTGLTVSFIDGNRVAWSRSWGVRDVEAPESWVWPWTVFDTGSLAKPVTSAVALQMAGTGAIDLMEDISQRGLRSVPELFQSRPGAAGLERGSGVTTYQLLSHCAGLGFAKQMSAEGETGIASLEAGARMPTPAQLITGSPPAAPEYRAVRMAPAGSRVIYSGINHTIAQVMIDDRASDGFFGRSRRFLTDTGMDRSGYEQPMPSAVAREAAYGHRRGRKLDREAQAAAGTAGLWSTAEDLADFILLLNQRGSVGGRQVLQPTLVDAMLGRDASVNRLCADRRMESATMAVGILVDRVGSRDEIFWHQGTQNGFRSYLFGLPGRGQGLAVTMSAGARDAEAFSRELLDAVAREYQLPRLPG